MGRLSRIAYPSRGSTGGMQDNKVDDHESSTSKSEFKIGIGSEKIYHSLYGIAALVIALGSASAFPLRSGAPVFASQISYWKKYFSCS